MGNVELGIWTVLTAIACFTGQSAFGIPPGESAIAKALFSLAAIIFLGLGLRVLYIYTGTLPALVRIGLPILVFGLIGASWLESLRMVDRREERANSSIPKQASALPAIPGNKTATSLSVPENITPTKYSEAEIAKRIEALEKIHHVVITSCATTHNMGQRLSSVWEQDILQKGPMQFAQNLVDFRTAASDCMREIDPILQKYGYFKDIEEMVRDHSQFQGPLFESTNQFIEAVNAIPPQSSSVTIKLASPQRDKFAAGVRGFELWINDMKERIAHKAQEGRS